MRFLLDVNVLIALTDSQHLNHDAAHSWFASGRDWATCPLTENAFVRVLSHPSYPTVAASVPELVAVLGQLRAHPRHSFIADDISLSDASHFAPDQIAGGKQLTDVYLLGLAAAHGARLATFDRRLCPDAAVGADASAIELIRP